MSDEIDDQPHDRRALFRLSFQRLMEPVANYIENRFDVSLPAVRVVLRPPGALEEQAFLATCYRCGNCVDVCPAKAIRTVSEDDVEQAGTPYVDADLAACVVCDELACVKACPSGALAGVESPADIEMGLARVDHKVCVRHKGEDCTRCADKCPIGEKAITIGKQKRIEVLSSGCVGCGVCQFYCPTSPKAIRAIPH